VEPQQHYGGTSYCPLIWEVTQMKVPQVKIRYLISVWLSELAVNSGNLSVKRSILDGVDLSADFDLLNTDTDDKTFFNSDRERRINSWSTGFNAVMGLNYEISDRILLGAEFLPRLAYRQYKDEITDVSSGDTLSLQETKGINFGFNSYSVLLSLVVKF
jgi:hypothetical protein